MNPKHQQLLDEAQEMYFGANGMSPEDAFAFDGDDFAASGDQWYSPMNPQGAGAENWYGDAYSADGAQSAPAVNASTIPDFDRTYTVTLTNTVAVNTAVTIFGANQFLTAVNFGLPATVTVGVGESTYQEMLFETQSTPFVVSGFRVSSTNVTQLDQVLTILKRDGNGQRCSYPLQVGNYFSAFQFQAGIREVYPYNITCAGTTQLSFTLLASATVVFTFFVGKRVGFDNLLHNRPVREVSVHKLPFVGKQQLSLTPNTVKALSGR